MTERINSAALTATSATFSPTSDFSVQAEIPAPSKAYVDIEGQVDAAASWVALGTIGSQTNPPVARFAKCPNVRLRMYNNDGVTSVKAWSGE
ncbi:hypothetical protein [Rhizobium leguminosarum]|uniref:hypothetical protein n=1 Tax=Rhizobium leguminosarum TaxID=384 RepID=UPI003F9CA156